MIDLPNSTTPEELAKHFGFSPRKLRSLARKIGACRIVGNRMILLPEDVEAILAAIKPQPATITAVVGGSYAELVALRNRTATQSGKKQR